MKKRFVSFALSLALLLALSAPAAALTGDETRSADILYTLGLVRGGSAGYELGRSITRTEAIALIVRLSGGESAALSGTAHHPFTDVASWAEGYVGYAYEQGLAKGVSAERFGGAEAAGAADCLTMLLRLLGYSDASGDFTYQTAALFACRMGLTDIGIYTAFTRGDMLDAVLRALTMQGKLDTTLIEKLTAEGTVEGAKARAVGFGQYAKLTARQIVDRYSNRVFYMECYSTAEQKAEGMPVSTSSGFFITADGLAATCAHAIAKGSYATVTLEDGKKYDVEQVLYYNAEADAALIRIAKTAQDGTAVGSFPAFACASKMTVYTGDVVYTISCPLSMSNSVSSGIVSHMDRTVTGYALPMIQNTASISQGSSGGVLLNEYGQAIGIVSSSFVYGNEMYLAIPIDSVLAVDTTQPGMTLAALHTQLLAQS